jgi:hypothetical protein
VAQAAKIQNFGVAALGHKDVCGLDIPVNDSLAVGGSECVSYLNSPFKHLFERHRLSGDAMLQRGAFHEFHRDERLTVLFADFVDRANVGMIQRGRGTPSLRKRSSTCGTWARSSGRNLSATNRPRVESSAL